jgi:hypothetical protein
MDFEFDPAKAAGNLRKHGVSFADAEGVFMDLLQCIALIQTLRARSDSWPPAEEALATYSLLSTPCGASRSG